MKFMKDRGFYKLFFTLTFTIALRNVIVFTVNLADNIMLGSYSESAMSGVALVNQIQFFLQLLVTGAAEGAHRDHLAIDRKTKYIDESGRNDFIESRAARDDENLYFYVKTRDNMTFAKKNDKMHTVLLLNTDGDYTTGWYGYDYVIGRARINGVLSVEKNLNNSFDWKVVATAPYVTKGNEKHLSVSKEAIGIEGNAFTVDFKWADNQPESLQIMDFIDKGDAAPNGRFNYRFEAK